VAPAAFVERRPASTAVTTTGAPRLDTGGLSVTGRTVSKQQQKALFARKDPRAHLAARRGADFDRLPTRKKKGTR